jgi:endonuclease-8
MIGVSLLALTSPLLPASARGWVAAPFGGTPTAEACRTADTDSLRLTNNGGMPEGDTIYRTAEVLRAALVGRRIVAARAPPGPGVRRVADLSRLAGSTVSSVEARGKHLLIGFDNGLTLRSHLRMRGSWHRYRLGEPWRRPVRRATAVLETAESVAVAFDTPVVELLTDAGLRRSTSLRSLGPDLLAPSFDAGEALRRLRDRGRMELGDALVDQGAVAGIGNVYKSEVAFIERLDPWATVDRFDDDQLGAALRTARRLMQANTRGGARVTTGRQARGESLWVYGRAGRPCRRCGTHVQSARQGDLARLTYWCPRCQSSA